MFQLIAIRPFENCRRHIKKCLKSDSFYYFCDLFVIRQDGSIIRNQDGKDIDSTFFKVNGGDTNIMLSAIVGKNGDGKSTIVELMMRLINNYTCNVEGLMTDVNPTIKVEGIAAEFYYLLDNAIYRLFDREGHGEVKLEKIATLGEQGNLIMLVGPEVVDNHNQLANQFFYTMVSNYSHYAYNIFDFKKEWSRVEEMGNNDNERCWLYYIFHKNDGYRTPLVLNPYRNQGNIDINNEAYLNRQRLISLFVDADEPQANRPTFRCLYGKTAKYATIEDTEESKLQQKTIIDFFTACKKDELLVKEINKTLEINENIVEHGNIIEGCLQLLRYIHANWIQGNEQLLQVIMEWDEMEKNRYNPLNEDRGFLTDRSDIKRWLEALTSVDFGNGSEQEKVYYVDAIRPYSHFNLAQLQRLGLIKYICYLLGGHAEEFYPGIDRFDLTMDEIACSYEQLTRDKKCQHYIVYKIISIFETYLEDYKRPCRMYDGAVIRENTIPNAYVANAVVKLWDDMRDRPSHINLKLRQALFYRQHYLREDGDVFREKMTLDELKDVIENTQELEQLPPPFLTVDIVFVSNTNHLEEISMETLSSGERQRLASLSGVVYHLRNIDSIDEERIQYHHINIVLEEIELYFHPECQRAFIKELIEAIEHIGLQSIKNVNILFVTHSPFILSDIPKTNVLLLEKGVPASEEKKRQLTTFGANIYDMLKTGFFLDGPVGAFAEYVIKNVVKSIRAEHAPELPIEDIKKRIELIDEPIMKQLLIDEYTKKYDKELKRLYLEEELRKLEGERTMWKLKQPTAIDLQNYENMMLQDLYDRVNNCVIEVIKNNLLPTLPDGTRDKRILKMLLTSNVYESYQESERLMGLIFNGYTRTELNLYFKAEHTKQVSRTEAQNNLIIKYQSTMKELVTVMGYKDAFANVKNAYQVTDWKGANACTYCNRSYIFTISTGLKNKDKVARPELDHWYAKSKYPLLSMNYYNLIPSCSVCNSSVKGSTSFDVRTHVHPYLQKAYNPSFNFCYNPAAPKWEQITIDDRQSSEREKNTVDAFKLRIVYNCHADLEAKELYDLAVSNGPRYIKDLLKLLSINYGKSEQDVYRMIFGTELAPQRFGERPMSKFKHDLLKQMKILKNGHYM